MAFSKAVIVWSMVLELSPFCCESMPPLLNVWAWHLMGEPIRTPQKKHPINNKRGILVKKDKACFKRLSLFFYLRYWFKLLKFEYDFGMIFLSYLVKAYEIISPCLRLSLFINRDKWCVISILCGDNSFLVVNDSQRTGGAMIWHRFKKINSCLW